MMKSIQWRPVALSLTVAGAVARLLPHPPNFTPVGAMSIYSGARLPTWQAYAVPLSIMIVTDPILNMLQGRAAFTSTQVLVYFSLMVSVWLGRLLRNTESVPRIGGVVLAASLQFFLITNLGTWYAAYPHTLAGLNACYVAALPFFERSLLGDCLFTAVLFGLHAFLSRTVATQERVPLAA